MKLEKRRMSYDKIFKDSACRVPAAAFDMMFVIMQRYNRQRIVKLIR